MSATHVYLSSLFDSRDGRRTGIARVEYKLARELVTHGAGVIRYSRLRRTFVTLDFQRDVEAVAAAQDLNLEVLPADNRAVSLTPFLSKARRRGPFADPRTAIRYQRLRKLGLSGGISALRPRPTTRFERGDVILVPGILWHRAPLDALCQMKHRRGARIIAYVHDLIPIRHPEFHTDAQGVARFRRYLEAMVGLCDTICVNSNFVGGDLADFARACGRTDLKIVTVPLCADITQQTLLRYTNRLASLELASGNFVTYVSTLNARKNHAFVQDLWRRLMVLTPAERLPTLILAGQKGWGVDDLVRQMTTDTKVWGNTVKFVESPTDEEVAYLYTHCAFTVFPSLYEGWGLGVTESLAFGKPCIAADNTALREASQGLAVHLDAGDTAGWLSAVRKMIEDTEWRHGWEQRIKREFQPRTWADIGRDVRSIIDVAVGESET